MRTISLVTPCYNEAENVQELYERVRRTMASLPYEYEIIFIDNASIDNTVSILRALAKHDQRVKVIVNTRNFGQVRSPYHAVLQTCGDAVVCLASDLQDPPEKIPEFVKKWEEGYKVVIGVKSESKETGPLFLLRSLYYRILRRLSDVDLIDNFTGFGMYDRSVIDIIRGFDDPYPYFRGMIADIGFPIARIQFLQPVREHGITKNNFYTLYDVAMLGLTAYTKIPLRLAAMVGFLTATISFVVGLGYLVYKLIFWAEFSVGLAPLVIGLFFLGSVQLIFLGIVGEYIGAIYTQVMHRPHVIEKERINF